MKMKTHLILCTGSTLLLMTGLAATLHAGAVPPEFTVHVSFNALVITNHGEAPGYHVFPSLGVSGWSDEFSPDNVGHIIGPFGVFTGGTNTGSTSVTFFDADSLKNTVSDPKGWRISILDGGTGQAFAYTFEVDTSTLNPADHLRPLTFTNLPANSVLPQHPAFMWSIPTPTDPSVDFDINATFLTGPAGAYGGIDQVPLNATQWVPVGPLNPGTGYTLTVQFQDVPATPLLVPGPVSPEGDAPALADFTSLGIVGTFGQASGLTVAPPSFCPADLNNDNVINTSDLTRLLAQFGLPCWQVTLPCADLNNDGVVNTADLTRFLPFFGGACD